MDLLEALLPPLLEAVRSEHKSFMEAHFTTSRSTLPSVAEPRAPLFPPAAPPAQPRKLSLPSILDHASNSSALLLSSPSPHAPHFRPAPPPALPRKLSLPSILDRASRSSSLHLSSPSPFSQSEGMGMGLESSFKSASPEGASTRRGMSGSSRCAKGVALDIAEATLNDSQLCGSSLAALARAGRSMRDGASHTVDSLPREGFVGVVADLPRSSRSYDCLPLERVPSLASVNSIVALSAASGKKGVQPKPNVLPSISSSAEEKMPPGAISALPSSDERSTPPQEDGEGEAMTPVADAEKAYIARMLSRERERKNFAALSSNDLRLVRAEELTRCELGVSAGDSFAELRCFHRTSSRELSPDQVVRLPSAEEVTDGAAELEASQDSTEDEDACYEQVVGDWPLPTGLWWVMRVCGVRLDSDRARGCGYIVNWQRMVVWLLAAIAIAVQLHELTLGARSLILRAKGCNSCIWFRATLGRAVLAAGAVLSLAATLPSGPMRRCWRGRVDSRMASIQDAFMLLSAYAMRRDFTNSWDATWNRDLRHTLLLWFLATVATVGMFAHDASMFPDTVYDAWKVSELLGVTFLRGLLLTVNLTVLRVCRCLALAVDVFCAQVVSDKDLQAAMTSWNVLQAVLLKASGCIRAPFVMLLLSVAAAAPAFLADMWSLGQDASPAQTIAVLPNLLVLVGVLRMSLIAAAVSETCSRVPAIINCHFFGIGTEQARQNAVDFVASSGAGFYVSEVRLNSAMIFKFMYLWAVLALGLGARIVSA